MSRSRFKTSSSFPHNPMGIEINQCHFFDFMKSTNACLYGLSESTSRRSSKVHKSSFRSFYLCCVLRQTVVTQQTVLGVAFLPRRHLFHMAFQVIVKQAMDVLHQSYPLSDLVHECSHSALERTVAKAP
jgi:hypothetical protein